MKVLKSAFIIVLIIALLSGPIPLFQQNVFAADPVNIKVESYSNGTLNISWDTVPGAKSYEVTYHDLDNVPEPITGGSENKCTISGLKNDFIYDIRVKIYNGENKSGSLIGEGLMYYLPRISFKASRVDQERKAIDGGGFEIGDEPRLKLEWKMPKIWDGSSVVDANGTNALKSVKDNLFAVYGTNIDVSTLNFRINISSSLSTLNSGSSHSSIIIKDYGGSGYKANVSGNKTVTAAVNSPDSNGYMSFDLLGRKDSSTLLPEVSEVGEHVLPDGDILPGTVFYMNIKPSYQNDTGVEKFVTTVGAPSDLNGSMLMGNFPYTYTPIRFRLSKDSSNNIYVKIYRVNQGSLDLPRLYYEVQSSDQIIDGDWTREKTIDDSFFVSGAESALTVVSGKSVNNPIFFKIVVKTDGTKDRIESMPMEYTLVEDTSKPPVPMGVTIVDRKLVTRTVEVNGVSEIKKLTDVTISWEKPANWDEIRDNKDKDKDIVYHVLLNVAEDEDTSMPYPELKAENTSYGYFPLKYRRVLYFSSKEVKENGKRLEYTIKGDELFKGSYYNGLDGSGNEVIVKEDITDSEKDYPNYLLPNKVYFMKMYTTVNTKRNSNEPDDMSDKSVVISFTTRSAYEIDVPLPKNLKINVNDFEIDDTNEISNYVELQLDKVNINWNNYLQDTTVTKAVYYDVFMSTRTDLTSFTFIGSTEKLNEDIAFIGANDSQSTSIKMTIKEFSKGTKAYDVFGPKLRPNTTYYFAVKTRISAEDMENDKESAYTALLSVTTVKGMMGEPDESSKRPYSPTDFKIALDSDGNQIVSSTRVSFSWTRHETDVVYNIICSSAKIGANDGLYEGENDAVYQSFKANFGDIILDPSLESLPDNFEYDATSKTCKFTVDKWLFPNKLYYFSIRAIKKTDTTIYSAWVSIPVTTSLIEQPEFLEAISNLQLGFFFNDEDIETEAGDYSVYLKSEKDLEFNLLKKNEYTIDKFGSTSYVRLVNLKENSYYDVKVYKNNGKTLVYTEEELKTRDSCHQIEFMWRGLPEYKYEVSIKAATDDSYVLLADANFEEYINANGSILPYYEEKNIKTSATNYEYFYARIKTIPIRLNDGSYVDQPLKSNTKYYIKVRAKKIDPVDTTIVSYSKYIGPINLRTDFNQSDYDEEDNKTKTEASFLDRIDKLEENLFWRINISKQDQNKLILKEDRVVNELENSGPYPLTLDISYYAENSTLDSIYIPINVISVLDTQNKSLLIRTKNAEYSIRPNTVDLSSRPEVKELEEKSNINEIYFVLNIGRSDSPKVKIPNGLTAVSDINKMEIKAIGTAITYKQLKNQIDDRVYNAKSGLVQKKLSEILNPISSIDSSKLNDLITESINDIERELSEYIYHKIEGGNGITSIVIDSVVIKNFDNPVLVKLGYAKQQGLNLPYVRYDGNNNWQKLNQSVVTSSDNIAFNVIKTGEYAILAEGKIAADLPDNYKQAPDIKLLLSRYDLSDVFGDMSLFYPDENVKVKEMILLYEKITGQDQANRNLTVNQKAQKYGLESLLGLGGVVRDVSRQETAKIVMMVYSTKTGVNINSLIPNRSNNIKDLSQVDSMYYKDVLISVDLGVISLDSGGKFDPNGTISRGEFVSAFVKVLKLTGDL
jgi:hypothetical protein